MERGTVVVMLFCQVWPHVCTNTTIIIIVHVRGFIWECSVYCMEERSLVVESTEWEFVALSKISHHSYDIYQTTLLRIIKYYTVHARFKKKDLISCTVLVHAIILFCLWQELRILMEFVYALKEFPAIRKGLWECQLIFFLLYTITYKCNRSILCIFLRILYQHF